MRESGGNPTADNPTADNPTSTAFGLGQLLLGNRSCTSAVTTPRPTAACSWAHSAYVRHRYGTAERAQAFWQANGWY